MKIKVRNFFLNYNGQRIERHEDLSNLNIVFGSNAIVTNVDFQIEIDQLLESFRYEMSSHEVLHKLENQLIDIFFKYKNNGELIEEEFVMDQYKKNKYKYIEIFKDEYFELY